MEQIIYTPHYTKTNIIKDITWFISVHDIKKKSLLIYLIYYGLQYSFITDTKHWWTKEYT